MPEATSIDTREVRDFSATNYAVAIILVLLNSLVGIFYAVKDRRAKNESPKEYLLGGKNQPVFPVAMSLTVTFLSSITLLGTPVEMYLYDTMYMYLVVAMLIAGVVSAGVFVPFFYRLGVTSIFQYLEMRFHPSVRLLGSFLNVVQMLIYMSFVLYAPSLAVSAVTGLEFSASVVVIGLVATFYTVMGGMKAVLWTDTYQILIMLAGLLAVLIKGVDVVGGFPQAWDDAKNRQRIVMDEFDFDPSKRHSVFTMVVGGAILWMSLYGANQAQLQRCMSTSSVAKAKAAVLISTPFLMLLPLLCCIIGIVMFAFYKDCDPVVFGVIDKYDQMLPLFVMDILGHMEGLPGVFVACIFSGSLSTMSSGLNAQSAVIFKEIQKYFKPNLTEMQATIMNKVIAGVCGGITIGLAFLVSELGTLQESALRVYGILNGPIFGLFILGMFFPWANSIGAFCGCVASLAFLSWVGIGGYVKDVKNYAPSPRAVTGCNWTSGETPAVTTIIRVPEEIHGIDHVYTISYMNYTMVGMAVVIVVGLLVSFCTGYTRPSSLQARLVLPIFSMVEKVKDEEDTEREIKDSDPAVYVPGKGDATQSNTSEVTERY